MTNDLYTQPDSLRELSETLTNQKYLKQLPKKQSHKKSKYSQEQIDLIRELVQDLDDEKKALLHLYFWENLTHEEISDMTGKRVSSIDKQLDLIVNELREIFFARENIKLQ